MQVDLIKKQQETLADLKRKLDQLPMLPGVIARLMVLDKNDVGYFDEILKLSQEDPAFATRLLRLANSASLASVSPITTLQQAIMRIGTHQIANLIMTMTVMRVFIPTTKSQRNLWIHAIQVAVAARTIARMNQAFKVDPEQAYLCGLLHDIGRFVQFEGAPDELGRVDESNWTTPQELVEVEKALCGFDHAELGWHACQKWYLPELISTVVREHHHYPPSATLVKESSLLNLIQVVQQADSLSVLMMLSDQLTWDSNEFKQLLTQRCVHRTWKTPPASPDQLHNQIFRIFHESKQVALGLGLPVHNQA